jgi:hypothetical protein
MTTRTYPIRTADGFVPVHGQAFEMKVGSQNFSFIVHDGLEPDSGIMITHEKSGRRITTLSSERLKLYQNDRVLAARIELAQFVDRMGQAVVCAKLREAELEKP